MDKKPLVSVIVVCYNAAEYIVETLESVKAQTYKNLELIVSDDCSKDGTSDIVKSWFEKNGDSFVRTELVTIDHNTGVSANYNRAVRACKGEWVKNVDGDDLITENCIQENIDYITKHPEASLVFSNALIFRGKNVRDIIGSCIPEERKCFFDLSAEDQFKSLLHITTLPSQTCFIKHDLLKQFPYNEKYVALEDAPMWINLTKNGIKVYYFDSYTAYYRKDDSMTNGIDRFFSPAYIESSMLFFWDDMYPNIKKYQLVNAYNENRKIHLSTEFAFAFLHNKKTKFNDFVFRIVRRLIYKYAKFEL